MVLFYQLIKRSKFIFILTLCISMLSIVVSLWWNFLLSMMINIINNKSVIAMPILLKAIVIIIVSSILSYIYGILSGITCETLVHNLRMSYARYFSKLSIQEMLNIKEGEYLSKLQNEITDAASYLNGNLFPLMEDYIRFIGTFTFMLLINKPLTIISHLPSIYLIFYSVYTGKIIETAVHKSQEANTDINCLHNSILTLFPIIQVFNAFPMIRSKYNKTINQWRDLSSKEENTRAKLMSVSALISCTPLLLLLMIGGTQAINKEISIGTLYLFLNLSGNSSTFMMNIPARMALLCRFKVNLQRIQSSILSANNS